MAAAESTVKKKYTIYVEFNNRLQGEEKNLEVLRRLNEVIGLMNHANLSDMYHCEEIRNNLTELKINIKYDYWDKIREIAGFRGFASWEEVQDTCEIIPFLKEQDVDNVNLEKGDDHELSKVGDDCKNNITYRMEDINFPIILEGWKDGVFGDVQLNQVINRIVRVKMKNTDSVDEADRDLKSGGIYIPRSVWPAIQSDQAFLQQPEAEAYVDETKNQSI